MVQAYAGQLLNQKESEMPDLEDSSVEDAPEHPIFAATRRLLAALERLEHGLERMPVAGNSAGRQEQQQQLGFFAQENESLRQERENLNTAISQLQFQYTDLHEVASAIYGKLDTSIKRLTKIIEQ